MRYVIMLFALLTIFFIACDSSTPPPATVTTTVANTPKKEKKKSPPLGAQIYRERCITCHGANGRMGNNGAKALPESSLTVAQRIEVVTNGRNIMPSFEGIMTPEEIEAVVQFTMTLK